jgi:transcription elongation factor GreB
LVGLSLRIDKNIRVSRHRPPATAKSPYITAEGYRRLHDEQQSLWKKRREVVRHLSAAAAEGDRSENAEYIYRKKQLREMDRRIRYLQKRLPELKVVELHPSDPDRVFFGAWVTLESEEGESVTYRIVGADEFDPKRNWISVDSPMARALLKRQVDEEFEVCTPKGPRVHCVLEVRYQIESAE